MRSEGKVKKVLPISLLVEDKPCLVVGGGVIAARKVGHLLAAGAAVTVVSPEVGGEIAAWKEEHKLSHKPRAFRATDVKGQVVVFAVTDNGPVNSKVVQACRRRRILCCAADAHWDAGDFLTPAIIRRPKVTVAVSTGGRSCSLARRIKEKLAETLAAEKL